MIAGGGPTGLMLAGELALAGVDVVVVERRPGPESTDRGPAVCTPAPSRCSTSAASPNGSSPRGRPRRSRRSPRISLDISDFPTRHNYGLGLWQSTSSASSRPGSTSSRCRSATGREVTGFAQDDAGVVVQLADGSPLRAEYLVGCDGGRSLVRKAAGIEFPGWDPTTSNLIAEAEVTEEPELASAGTPAASTPSAARSTRSATARWCSPTRAGAVHGHRGARRTTRPSRRCASSARRSSTSTGPTSGCTSPAGSRGSPT